MTDEKKKEQGTETLTVPLLPLRDIVLFPESVMPLFVGRTRSMAALETSLKTARSAHDRIVALSVQKEATTEEPGPEDIHLVCTLGVIKTVMHLQNKMMKVLVLGKRRGRIKRFVSVKDWDKPLPPEVGVEPWLVEVEPFETTDDLNLEPKGEDEKQLKSVTSIFAEYVKYSSRLQPEILDKVEKIPDDARRIDIMAGYIQLKSKDKQALLAQESLKKRLELLLKLLKTEVDILRMQKKVKGRFKNPKEMRSAQASHRMRHSAQDEMQEELRNELMELEERLSEKPLTEEAKERVKGELRKLRTMSPMSAEASVVRGYLDWMSHLPWQTYTEDRININEAENILNADHYGLEKVKDRILEHLAVQKLTDQPKGPILCLVGPPGVGKTSLARSIARSTGRDFVRLSLGGVRDEAEIRGHRRTYIGAMPGKIIASLKRCGTSNPAILLDEIDKMSNDFRGDPASALLEVLDPEQNGTFVDHYLDLDYDLSQILFVCTANNLSGISQPLLDRMEMIRISGYTDYEKSAIAKTYLIPKQLEANGLAKYEPVDKRDKKGRRVQEKGAKITFDDEAIKKILENYTREAGVRNLERAVGTCCRKAAILLLKKIEEDIIEPENKSKNTENSDEDVLAKTKERRREQLEGRTLRVTQKRVREFLGIEKYKHREQEKENKVGLTHGLAWTSVGGEVLVTEVALVPGKGKLTITGKLGDVMQESAQAAMTYVRSRATALGLARDFYNRLDIHIHVPAGGTPKDGPSAGITLATSLVSALTRVPVRHDVAMTGEITLRGQVMAIGGLKEKALAAYRQGITTILMPAENEKDLEEIPNSIRSEMTFIPVENVDEVMKHALALEGTELLLADLSDAVVDILDEVAPVRKASVSPDEGPPASGVH